jgi:hypothetical protein
MTTAKRQTIADFMYYSICQGQSEIGPIGYSSLPVNLVTAGFTQIGKLKTADAKVNLTNRNVSTCHNPTFIAGKPNVNHLAVIAPQPPACDKTGAGPCAAGVGAYNGSASGATAANNASSNSGGGAATTGNTATTGSTGTGSPSSGSPATTNDLGLATADSADTSAAGAPVATTLGPDAGSGPSGLLTGVLVVLLLAVIAIPAGLGAVLVRRRGDIS